VVIALVEACGCLFEVLAQLQGFQSPAAWETALARGVHRLCGSGEDDGWQSPELYDLLTPLRSAASQALLLKTFDSETDGRARFMGHTAFEDPTTPPGALMRESIEVRTMAVF
jgi:hypothetical protein